MTPPASVDEFKAQFDRDFKYGKGLETIRDIDITRAQVEALTLFNPCLWPTEVVKMAYNYATAHMLVTAVQAAGGLSPVNKNQGTQNRGGGIMGSKSVGGVSVNYAGLETWVQKFPSLSDFMRTDYGQKYLFMLKPRMVGNVTVVAGPKYPDTLAPNIPFS